MQKKLLHHKVDKNDEFTGVSYGVFQGRFIEKFEE